MALEISRVRKRLVWAVAALALAIAALTVLSGTGVGLVMSSSRAPQAVDLPLPEPSERFDGDQAFVYLREICNLGPRISDTPAMRRQQQILKQHFEKLGATVELQEFQATQPSLRGKRFAGANLIVRWHPKAKHRVLLGAHYDTRPIADQEPVFRNRNGVFLGANDGGSGVAFLMELGRLMPSLDLKVGVDFVFFDAEEYIFAPNQDKYFLGSEYFVQQYVRGKRDYVYDAVVVVDMIADKDLQIHPDERSITRAGALVREVWEVARDLKVRQFQPDVKYDLLDDHTSFHAANIPAIVLIDFDYPHWHRLSDTPERCSGKSLEVVSRVVVEWLRRRQEPREP